MAQFRASRPCAPRGSAGGSSPGTAPLPASAAGAPLVESLVEVPTQRIGDAARAGVLEPFGAKLELVGAVLGCAAQLLRLGAVVPVKARAEPSLAVPGSGRRKPAANTAACSESDESGSEAGSASDDDEGTCL